MNWEAAVRFIGGLIDLIFLEKQLDILEMTKDRAYELADKQVALAEMIVELHCQLLAKTTQYYTVANSAPTYQQQYNCAMSLANIDAIRDANTAMNNGLDTLGMYSAGLRRDYTESAMSGVVFASSGQWALAYRNEDELATATDLRKYKHMVDSINGSSLFTGHHTLNRLGSHTVDLAKSTSKLIEGHLQSFTTGVTDYVVSRDSSSNSDVKDKVKAARDARLGTLSTQVNSTDPIPTRQSASDRKVIRINDPVSTTQSTSPASTVGN